MKYAVWALRLVFGAWMVPVGLEHFYHLFAQPMGNVPVGRELIVALIASHLFDIVKAVELLAGLSVLTGLYVPLALAVCMPVSFCVFWWDAPIEGWGSIGAPYGEVTLICNCLLCLAYFKSYRAMFALRSTPRLWGAPPSPGDAPAAAEARGPDPGASGARYDAVFVNPKGRTSRGPFIAALVVLLAVSAFYAVVLRGLEGGGWILVPLLFPGFVLHGRRLHDLGKTAWLAALPLGLVAAVIWPRTGGGGAWEAPLVVVATVVYAGFALWCCLGKGQTQANRFGAPA